MTFCQFKNVVIESMAVNLPPIEVTSAAIEDRLAPLYQRLGIPFGTLEKLSAVRTRYFWEYDKLPSQVATVAAERAIDQSGIPRAQIGALVSCSVTRDYFEPATALMVHRNLGLSEDSLAFDVSNACIGFTDGLGIVAQMIESGVIKAGVVVSGETISKVLDVCIEKLLQNDSVTREEFLKVLPTFTLGSGAVSYVLCHKSIAKSSHRLLASVGRSASQFSDLCIGNGDYCLTQGDDFNPIMHTESAKLIAAAAQLGARTWADMSKLIGWKRADVDHIFCHQVGRQVNEAFYNELGLDFEKEYTIYRSLGNMISAALPTALTLGSEELKIKPGAKVVCTAFGSGLNCRFLAIEW